MPSDDKHTNSEEDSDRAEEEMQPSGSDVSQEDASDAAQGDNTDSSADRTPGTIPLVSSDSDASNADAATADVEPHWPSHSRWDPQQGKIQPHFSY